jgi:ribosome-binding protein aMBF1 (putative translation factor)
MKSKRECPLCEETLDRLARLYVFAIQGEIINICLTCLMHRDPKEKLKLFKQNYKRKNHAKRTPNLHSKRG